MLLGEYCVLFNAGATQVIAAAYGPVEVRSNKELLDKSYVEVIFRPKVGLPGKLDHFSITILNL